MKKNLFAMITLGLFSSTAFAETTVTCVLYEGLYTSKNPIRKHVSGGPEGTSLRFYGGDTHNGVSFIWGINIGASVPDNSQNQFQIFASDDTATLAHAEMDHRKGIDLSLYVKQGNVSVRCKESAK